MWLIPIAIGALLGTVRQIRPEPVAIVVCAAAACLLVARASWWRRAALAAVLVASFLASSRAWLAYFDYKFEEARQVVAAAGGKVYQGRRDRYHTFWHPLWCGLGDFGQKYGYEWRDKAAATYARPIVQERYREMGREPDLRYLFWDPVYNDVLGEKVVHDISHDPLWYLGVLARRLGRILTWTTPVRLSAGPWSADLPWNGLATVPVVLVLAWTRSWPLLKVVLFPLGTSIRAAVFSGDGARAELHGLVRHHGGGDRPGRAGRGRPRAGAPAVARPCRGDPAYARGRLIRDGGSCSLRARTRR